MLKLGLTGGIGAGKSTVARRLAERGAVVVDADQLAREVVEPGTSGLAAVVTAFGAGVLAVDGTLDRAALGRQVFADDTARRRLNGILHPRIAALTTERMRAAGPGAIVVHDVPLLVENRMGAAYHLVLVVHASVAERVRRLVTDRGMSEQDAAARVVAQADDDARRAAADVWLDNSRDPQALIATVDRLWDDRVSPYAENLRLRRPAAPLPPGGPADAAAVRRLIERLRWAVGDAVCDVQVTSAARQVVELVLLVADLAVADGSREPLEDAGFVRVADGDPAQRRHVGADPQFTVTVHVEVGERAAKPAGHPAGGGVGA